MLGLKIDFGVGSESPYLKSAFDMWSFGEGLTNLEIKRQCLVRALQLWARKRACMVKCQQFWTSKRTVFRKGSTNWTKKKRP